jgi:hypothetical protein
VVSALLGGDSVFQQEAFVEDPDGDLAEGVLRSAEVVGTEIEGE